MKKVILFAFLGAGLFTAQAQNATLNVVLHPVQSIIVSAGSATVNLVYDDAAKYTAGVTLAMNDHLQVYSTGGFQVSVAVPSATFGNGLTAPAVGSTDTIAASGIKVLAGAGTTNSVGATFNPAVALSTTAQPLFTSTNGGAANKYKVTYTGAGADAYVGKKYTAGAAATTYTTQVVYSIAAN